MTKKEIVKQISEKLGLTQLKVKEIVQETFDSIIATLLEERRIELRNFGVFEVKRRKPRKARNPRTGVRVDVDAKYVVTFKPGKEMEEEVRKLDAADSKPKPQVTLPPERRETPPAVTLPPEPAAAPAPANPQPS
ncbi:MAG: integration host factor subunit beta [Gemmataceae bacterium]|nr:integration host factor subunit beta [Gemmataceae bacterium]